LRIFIKEQVDVAILEVGIGGRLDATNVIEKPQVCGITTLDLDHTRVLGNTIDLIAYAVSPTNTILIPYSGLDDRLIFFKFFHRKLVFSNVMSRLLLSHKNH
jgi:hypothetical protein